MVEERLSVPGARLGEFCSRHHIRKMALFGSVLRDDFGPDSDVDVLVEFHPDHVPGFMGLAGMELEFSEFLGGRKVDLNTPGGISRYYIDEVLAEAEVLHDET